MNVCSILATCGRHTLLERSVRFFLDQDYQYKHRLLIYNNSEVPLNFNIGNSDTWDCDTLGECTFLKFTDKSIVYIKSNKIIHLINNHIDKVTGKKYTNLGAIYRDALHEVPEDTEVISFWDDDDIFLPNHISEGINGLDRGGFGIPGGFIAYKPERSYYRHPGGLELMGNNLEPSVFVSADHIRENGFHLTTSDQHLKWFNSLLQEGLMFIDPNGTPTMIYNWGDTDIPTFKTSGNSNHPNNFENYRSFSQDHGDGMITPWSKEQVEKYYDLVYVNNK